MIYLDNAASAPVLDCALNAAEPFLRDCWGNPSSIHTEGRRAAPWDFITCHRQLPP